MNGIFDSHAHYDDERFDADRDELLESIHREGVEYIMTIGADLPTSYAARELAERYDFVYFAAGIHPEQAGDAPENYLEELKALAAHPKCRAIGEIGLDYYWAENPPKERQMELFRQQVLLAKELGLPVIIHDREAHADTLALLRELHPAGVLHCFSGSVEMAKEVAALGMYLGFTGAITFKNARKAPQAAAAVPADRLLIETDCPYMAPEPYRGKRCDSSMLPRVAPELSQATYWYYKNAHTIDQKWSVRACGVRQRHIDQAQSVNLYITNEYTLRQVLELYVLAWECGVKTVYYVRSKSLEVEECESCSS